MPRLQAGFLAIGLAIICATHAHADDEADALAETWYWLTNSCVPFGENYAGTFDMRAVRCMAYYEQFLIQARAYLSAQQQASSSAVDLEPLRPRFESMVTEYKAHRSSAAVYCDVEEVFEEFETGFDGAARQEIDAWLPELKQLAVDNEHSEVMGSVDMDSEGNCFRV